MAPQKEAPFDFNSIGVSHNKGLEYSLNFINTNRGTDKISLPQLLKLNKAASIEYILKTYPNLSESNRVTIISKMESLNQVFIKNVDGRTNDAADEMQAMLDQISPNLTATQKNHINNIFSTVVNLDYDINAIQASLNSIESQANALPYEEGGIVLAAVSVARNSSYYWNENIDSWVNVGFGDGGGNIPRTEGPIRWGGVAAADVAGAVIMGGGLKLLGLIPEIGWAAWGIATGGYALLASGGAALVYYNQPSSTHTSVVPNIP